LDVLYEDEYLLAIHKPAGVRVSGNHFKTIKNGLPEGYQPVHRLDYPTTGILLIGKTPESVRLFNQMFEKKEIKKTYYAIVIGELADSGIFDQDIDTKYAKTNFKNISQVSSDRFDQLTLIKAFPETGRRHQIRKHLALSGRPILGDQDYSPPEFVLKGKGLYLHASELCFIHPFNKKEMVLRAPIPNRFKKIFPEIKWT